MKYYAAAGLHRGVDLRHPELRPTPRLKPPLGRVDPYTEACLTRGRGGLRPRPADRKPMTAPAPCSTWDSRRPGRPSCRARCAPTPSSWPAAACTSRRPRREPAVRRGPPPHRPLADLGPLQRARPQALGVGGLGDPRPQGTTVISSETLCLATDEQIARILGDLSGVDVDVVVTVRDPARQVPAEWQEGVKHGRRMGYDEFLDTVLAEPAPEAPARRRTRERFWKAQDPAPVLDRWADHVGPSTSTSSPAPPPGAAARPALDPLRRGARRRRPPGRDAPRPRSTRRWARCRPRCCGGSTGG